MNAQERSSAIASRARWVEVAYAASQSNDLIGLYARAQAKASLREIGVLVATRPGDEAKAIEVERGLA